MKKIIVLVLCLVNVTCLGMNNNKQNMQDLIALQKRQTEALELLATSQAMQACMQIQERNKQNITQYTPQSCLLLSFKFEELTKKDTWK